MNGMQIYHILLGCSTNVLRWADGRKYWSQLIQASRNLARTIWINTGEREGELGKKDLLRKLYELSTSPVLDQANISIGQL
jgi:predicted membrane chloride channel (bestrophin family)